MKTLERTNILHETFVSVAYLLLLIIVICCIKTLFFQIAIVKGDSMTDTLRDGEVLFVDVRALFRHTDCFDYQDIVIVRYPGRKEQFVKRIVGKPGDKIQIADGVLYRNDTPVHEPYIKEEMYMNYGPYIVGEGEYFVMGDNRNNSNDSTNVGAIPMKSIIGKAYLRVFPFHRFRLFIGKQI